MCESHYGVIDLDGVKSVVLGDCWNVQSQFCFFIILGRMEIANAERFISSERTGQKI